MGCLYRVSHTFLITYLAQILLDLLGWGKEVGPLVIRSPGKLVVVAGNIAPASWVLVLEPGAADVRVLLVHHELEVGQAKAQSANHVETAGSGADNDNPDGLGGAQRLFADLVRGILRSSVTW